ncbi:tetratricopeptide repeat protein [Deinococcus hohokamensis]|uniref:Tetratricopeptide repeat protein n=1 Tax=Deinococcus hohokamensis TaxID=309883 RepID=A0ABV9I4Q5_9DEIO
MTHPTRTTMLGLFLAVSTPASAQSLVEVVTTTSIQNTLQQTATPSPAVPQVPTGAAPATTPAAPAKPAVVITPLTDAQRALMAQAQAAFQAGQYPLARSRFEALVAQNYTHPDAHFGLALTLLAQNDEKGAAFEFTQFQALAPERYEGPYNLGVIATRQGRFDDALRLYTEAQALMKDQAPPAAQRQVLEALATEQTRRRDYAALSITLESITALEPSDLSAQYRLAQARTLSGQGTAALPGVYALLQRDPARADAALLLADIYVTQGLPDRALRELDAAAGRVTNGGDRALLLLRKADILAGQGNTRAAVLAAQDATREDSRNAAAFARLGELRALRNDRPGALTAYQNAVKLAPQSAVYRTGLAAVRLALGQSAQAALDAAQALKLSPDSATLARALYVQGVSAYQQRQYAQARTALQSSLRRVPSAEAALWLGLSAYAQKDYASAASALAESVKLNPTPTARQNLASALLASARYPEAEAILRGLVTETPRNAEAWYLLGLTHRAQQRSAEARAAFKTAANLGSAKAREALK